MIITKKESENYDYTRSGIVFSEEDKQLSISYEGVLDLFFSFKSQGDNYLEITKENYYIYECFLKLYNRIKNNEIFELDEIDLLQLSTIEDLKQRKQELKELNEREKRFGKYDELFHDNVISWVSDDYSEDGVNYDFGHDGKVSITKEEDKFILTFEVLNPCAIKYCSNDMYYTTVRFRNSGSSYAPYNIVFMDLYKNLMKYDANDKQIHMEEYLYSEKEKIRKR